MRRPRILEPDEAEGFNLTTDVIAGFPAEDDAAFRRTLDLVRAAGITKVHVFPYSPRPGTRTAGNDPVAPEVKRERSRTLRVLSAQASAAYWRSRLGSEDVVLVDRPGRGYANDYTSWLVDGEVGEFVPVRAVGATEQGAVGAR